MGGFPAATSPGQICQLVFGMAWLWTPWPDLALQVPQLATNPLQDQHPGPSPRAQAQPSSVQPANTVQPASSVQPSRHLPSRPPPLRPDAMVHSCPSAYPPGQARRGPRGFTAVRPARAAWAWGLALLPGAILLGQAKPAQAELLYRLDTRCSLQGAAPVPCTVEAIEAGEATLYRHQISGAGGAEPRVETVRILAKPVRMARWDQASKAFVSLSRAAARFSTNTVCFNGSDLCVVNPNYLNSVRQANSSATEGRDLVRVHFGADGRIDASCYDAGCAVSHP